MAATSTAYAAPTTTPYPTATIGPSPTPIPTATATPKPQPKIALQVRGNGEKNSSDFTVEGTWQLSWTCSGGGLLYIYVQDVNDPNGPSVDEASYDCPQQSGGDSSIEREGGTFFLSILAITDYTITVTDVPN